MFRTRIAVSLSALCALFAAGAVVAPAASAAGPCANADAAPAKGSTPASRAAVLCLLNQERAAHRLRPLRSNKRLRVAALRHSAHMARRDFFDHTTPSGTSMTDRIRRSGYTRGARGWAIGENIAWGAGQLATPRQIVAAWMRSPGHRANVLNGSFREIGIGVALGAPVRVSASTPGATYTTDFGVRR